MVAREVVWDLVILRQSSTWMNNCQEVDIFHFNLL